MSTLKTPLDPTRDLVFERIIDVPRALVWAAWTTPEHVKKWFTPAPWKTVDCEIDLRPGGLFRTMMQSPEGKDYPNIGCYLEVVPNERLTWTSALGPGYRPLIGQSCPEEEFPYTATVILEAHGQRTKYTAVVLHHSEADRKAHEAKGFHAGWGAALDQLVALVTPLIAK